MSSNRVIRISSNPNIESSGYRNMPVDALISGNSETGSTAVYRFKTNMISASVSEKPKIIITVVARFPDFQILKNQKACFDNRMTQFPDWLSGYWIMPIHIQFLDCLSRYWIMLQIFIPALLSGHLITGDSISRHPVISGHSKSGLFERPDTGALL